MGLENFASMALPIEVHMACLLGDFCLLPVAFLCRHFLFSGYSYLHGSLLQLQLHTLPSQGAAFRNPDSAARTLPGLPGFPLKSGWKRPGPSNSCILHAFKTSITGAPLLTNGLRKCGIYTQWNFMQL
jgi:hypothetical protein